MIPQFIGEGLPVSPGRLDGMSKVYRYFHSREPQQSEQMGTQDVVVFLVGDIFANIDLVFSTAPPNPYWHHGDFRVNG